MFDLWEQQLASGQEVDFNLAFAPGELERISKKLEAGKIASAYGNFKPNVPQPQLLDSKLRSPFKR